MEITLKKKYSNLTSKIIAANVYYVTCFECCKYYIVPTTASCGHSLCHTCWYGRQSCPNCGIKIDRKSLKLNLVLQNLTEHIHNLQDASKDIFGPTNDYMSSMDSDGLIQDPTKNVNEWLSSSQNHFSAPVTTPESIPELTIPSKIVVKDIQVHQENKMTTKSVCIDQKDWNKIEELPDSEDIINKDKENIIGPMDIEPLEIIDEDEEYSTENPRRSSRNRDITSNNNKKDTGKSLSKINKNKNTNNWTTVKNMKQEFSKLNKKSKNKLNVSVEVAKTVESGTKNLGSLENTNNEPVSDVDKVSSFTSVLVHEPHEVGINDNQANGCDAIKNGKDKYTKANIDAGKNTKLLGPSNRTNETYLYEKLGDKEKLLYSHGVHSKNNVSFFKRSAWSNQTGFKVDTEHFKNETSEVVDTDDVEITIKVGKTVANICIKKKDNDVKVKVNSESGIQPSITKNNIINKISVSTSPLQDYAQDKGRVIELANKSIQASFVENKLETVSKKNTASAETSTLNTDKKGTERQLSSINELEEIKSTKKSSSEISKSKLHKPEDYLNDFDMFDSESVKEGNVQALSRSVQTPSAIFMPSNVSKVNSLPKSNKRERDEIETDVPNKKGKITPTMREKRQLITLDESEPGDYNEILDRVFENINEDMKEGKATDSSNYISNTEKNRIANCSQKSNISQKKKHITNKPITQKCSENIFSLLENELELENSQNKHKSIDINKIKATGSEKSNIQLQCVDHDIDIVSTPQNDDSDRSVVEETPQKDISHTKSKQIDTSKTRRSSNKKESMSVVNVDITEETKVTIIENHRAIETPASMYKFVNNLHHKSTPLAKKSLDFNDPDQTLCTVNTQEKEIMCKAFEQIRPENKKYCLVASCLTPPDVARVKLLCTQRKWTFVDKFTPDVTHLIVSVTEENRAQRSVKFICALAASKWIVSMEWIHKCLNSKEIANEEPHEVLDMTGEPGPRRSRLARLKLFTGIKFYCMPPFGVLSIETLKEILVFAGGEVVNELNDVKATENPSLLLAEPESTQEDRFIFLAMHLGVVPVNYEWVLNSLGCYTLASIVDLLMCPDSLLPQVISKWPRALISSQDSIDD